MHIIVIICDTLRRDHVGTYGNDWIRTPNMDALAQASTVFDRTLIGSFPTIPQRAELMTGHHVFHTTGWAPLQPGEVPFQNLLKDQGYVNAMITDNVQYMAPGMNYHQGFDAYRYIRGHQADRCWSWHDRPDWPCDPNKLRQPEMLVIPHLSNARGRRFEREWHDPMTVQTALDWLEDNYRQEQFALYLDLFGIHEPWDPPQYYMDLYADPAYAGAPIILPRYDHSDYASPDEIRDIRARYAAMVTMTDRWIGRLIDKLQLMDIWDDTAILFTSDHGWYHGEHGYLGKHTVVEPQIGWPLYHTVSRVPLFIKVPGIAGGQRSEALVQPVDIAPTLMELGGATPPEGLHGHSLLPVVRGETSSLRDLAISAPRLSTDPTVRVCNSVSDGEWTLIDKGQVGDPELYHWPSDPDQLNDLAADQPRVVQRLRAAYRQYLVDIGTDRERLTIRGL